MIATKPLRSAKSRLRVEPLEARCLLTILVTFETSLGNFDVELYDDQAPLTVQNFLNYVDDGDYAGTIIHRSVSNFVIQGGGFDTSRAPITTNPPVQNEPGISNTRGTIAMAKLGGDPNSATSQWFFNLGDNSANLDNQNGGFTVFGRVIGDGMTIVDAIAALPTFNFSGAFTNLPLRNYTSSNFPTTPTTNNYVVIHDVVRTVSETTGTVTGNIFRDTSADGIRNGSETGAQGFSVWIDTDGDSILDPTEPQGVSDSQGNYTIDDVPTGTFSLRIGNRSHVLFTTPNGGQYSITVTAGGTVSGRDFGVLEIAAPATPDLSVTSDTGTSNADDMTSFNNANASTRLTFTVAGVMPGAEVRILANGTAIGQATATGTSVQIETNGSFQLGDGVHSIVAQQTFHGVPSEFSASIHLTVDTLAPEFTSGNPGLAAVDSAFAYDADSNEEAAGVAYELFAVDGQTPIPTGLSINASTGMISWTPSASQQGNHSFGIRVRDKAGNTREKTFTVEVRPPNHAPVAGADEYDLIEDQVLTVLAVDGVLKNDSDQDGEAITAQVVEQPTHGTLALQADGSFTYTPDANFFGTDSFTYRAHDGISGSTAATVTLHVTGVADPIAAVADTYQLVEDEVFARDAVNGLLANDLNPEDEDITAILESNPTHGTLTLNADGSFQYDPAANFSGTDSFTYRIGAGDQQSGPVTVTLNIQAVNDLPNAVNDTYTVDEDMVLDVAARGVLANDTDVESSNLTAAMVRNAQHGTVVLRQDGSFNYVPNANFFGTDTFTYRAADGQGGTRDATVTITVNPVDDPPVIAVPFGVSVAPGQEAQVSFYGSDVDGATEQFHFTLIQGQETGATIDPHTGEFRWIPESDADGAFEFAIRLVDASGNLVGETREFTVNVFSNGTAGAGLAALRLSQTAVIPPQTSSQQIAPPIPLNPPPPVDPIIEVPQVSKLSRIQSGGGQVTTTDSQGPTPNGGNEGGRAVPEDGQPASDNRTNRQVQGEQPPSDRERVAVRAAAIGLLLVEGVVPSDGTKVRRDRRRGPRRNAV